MAMNKDDMIHYVPFVMLVTGVILVLTLKENFVPLMLNFIMFAVPGFAMYWIVRWTFWPEEGEALLPHQRLIKEWRNK
jgi:uncharacterized membrane-anchored protein